MLYGLKKKPPGCSLPLTASKKNKIQDLGTDIKSNSDHKYINLFQDLPYTIKSQPFCSIVNVFGIEPYT